jgi:hypothetical protein
VAEVAEVVAEGVEEATEANAGSNSSAFLHPSGLTEQGTASCRM